MARKNAGSGRISRRTCSWWTIFGLREFTPQQSGDLDDLVCQRDQHKSWILVSNRLPQDRHPLFPNPVLAEGILDRLVNSSYAVVLQGKSTSRAVVLDTRSRPRPRPRSRREGPGGFRGH